MRSSTGTSIRDLAALLAALLLAACGAPPAALEEIHREGYRALAAGDLERARSLAAAGAGRAREQPAPEWERPFAVLDAEALVLQRRSKEALERLDTALTAPGPRDAVQARALMTRGYARCFAPDGENARGRSAADLDAAAELASTLGEPEIAAEVTLRLGTCALLRDDLAAAERSFRAALEMGEGLPAIAAQAAGSLGNLRAREGRFDAAADWLRRALDLAAGSPAEGLRAKTWGNLGWCYYRLGDHERAVEALTQAEALAARLGLVGDRLIALTNLGRTLHARGDYRGAQQRFDLAARAAREIRNPREAAALLAEIRANQAALALEQGRHEEAASLASEAVRLQVEQGDETGRQRALLLQAEVWARGGQPARAEALYREVIGSRQAAPESSWEAHAGLARLHVRAARVADAEVELALAFELMERSLSQLVAIEHRLPFFSSLGAFYDDYVDFLVGQGRVVEALEVADRSHARLLRERLGGAGARTATGRDYPRLARELDALLLCYWTAADRSFLWIVTAEGVELVTLPGEQALGQWVAGHQARIQQSRDPLTEGSAEGVSLYETLVGPAAAAIPPSARVLVVPDGPLHQLNFETLVVADPKPRYWIEDVVLAIAPSLGLLAAGAGGAREGGDAVDAGSAAGGAELAGPARAAGAPGEAPGAGAAAGAGGVGLAATLGAPSLLVLGDPVSVGDALPPLPHAGREISRIAALFPPEHRRVYSGPRATPAAYRGADPGRFTFIHFAAHAQANQVVPLDSAIVLSARDQDYKLYAREIVSLPLRAELVTLSACRSAGSRAFEGEGLVGLAWAFLNSGAANVIGALWNVEDASTADLMEHLYRELAAGADPAVALRRAKLKLLRSGTAYRKPYYWGPFVTFTARG